MPTLEESDHDEFFPGGRCPHRPFPSSSESSHTLGFYRVKTWRDQLKVHSGNHLEDGADISEIIWQSRPIVTGANVGKTVCVSPGRLHTGLQVIANQLGK
jgi:hypothetical protein